VSCVWCGVLARHVPLAADLDRTDFLGSRKCLRNIEDTPTASAASLLAGR